MAKYSRDFKVDALKLSDEIGTRNAAEELGISRSTLLKWRRAPNRPQLEEYADSLKNQENLTSTVESLEQEISELKHANAILLDAIKHLSEALAS